MKGLLLSAPSSSNMQVSIGKDRKDPFFCHQFSGAFAVSFRAGKRTPRHVSRV